MKEKTKCPHDPRIYEGYPLGMYHCPVCLEMVIAGMEHPDPIDEEEERRFLEEDKRRRLEQNEDDDDIITFNDEDEE